MKKSIFIQSLLQIIIICIVILFGEKFLPEYADDFDKMPDFFYGYKYSNLERTKIISGRLPSHNYQNL